ncbi:Hypothetical protein AA314_01098 [Archangium gephyra]|uniref:Uncharacterized protein n=1 Tax=Archangium gephyra TaxID=48 RepID=A0AAC8TB59_9BACT|nr:Hypothetical protein AA314_01098 [Archangium gephyra]
MSTRRPRSRQHHGHGRGLPSPLHVAPPGVDPSALAARPSLPLHDPYRAPNHPLRPPEVAPWVQRATGVLACLPGVGKRCATEWEEGCPPWDRTVPHEGKVNREGTTR